MHLVFFLFVVVFVEVLSSSIFVVVYTCDAFLLAYKSHMDSICLFLSSLRASIYVISITLFFLSASTLGAPSYLVYAFFLLLYLEFGALHSSMPRYDAIQSFSGFFFSHHPKSFFAYYHSIVNVMYSIYMGGE